LRKARPAQLAQALREGGDRHPRSTDVGDGPRIGNRRATGLRRKSGRGARVASERRDARLAAARSRQTGESLPQVHLGRSDR
jgi:hypothetical protein